MRIGFVAVDSSIMRHSLGIGLQALGHEFMPYVRGKHFDQVWVFNVIDHGLKNDLSFSWAILDELDHPRVVLVDGAEYGWWTRLRNRALEFSDLWAEEAMKARPKPQEKLRSFFSNRWSFPYFLREKSRYLDYPSYYHTLDYPMHPLAEATVQEPVTLEQFKARPYDVVCIWGHSHPARAHITRMLHTLEKTGLKVLASENKVPPLQYHQLLQQARISISYDGYGSGSFRETEILPRCALLRGRLDVERPVKLIDRVDYREFFIHYPRGYADLSVISTNFIDVLLEMSQHVEGTYGLYYNGWHRAMGQMTAAAMAVWMLNQIDRHDWEERSLRRITLRV